MARYSRPRESFFRSEHGTTSIDYAVILGLIGTIAVNGIVLLGNNMNQSFQNVGNGGGTSGSSGSQTPASQTVFSDSFTNAKASAGLWDFNSSTAWKVANGELQGGPSTSTLIAYAKNSSITNGTVSLDATLNAGWGVAVQFRLSGDSVSGNVNGYSFQYDAGYGTGAFTLYKIVNGVEVNPPFAIAYPPAGYQWYGVERQITVTMDRAHFTATVSGVTVLTANDNSYHSGGVGLRLWNGPSATIQNFTVTSN